jgi:hypothetical protein
MRKQDLHIVVSSAAFTVVVVVLVVINYLLNEPKNITRLPSTYRRLYRSANIRELLYGTADSCVSQLRMGPEVFLRLAQMMRDNQSLRDTKNVTVEEQLAFFLSVVGHNDRNRKIRTFFYRSTRTVSVYVRRVLRAINSLKHLFIKAPSMGVHPKIAANRNWYPYFKVSVVQFVC